MTINKSIINRIFNFLLSDVSKKKGEKVVIILSIVSFIIHLLIIELVKLNLISLNQESELLRNPISAIYTPFSFILVYEVYLLVYYLPKSTSFYIAKQYEIISLIVIRRLFKDLSTIELTENWFAIQDDLQFTYDLIATILLFILIYYFYKLNPRRDELEKKKLPSTTLRFIKIKKYIAILLIPIFFVVAIVSFGEYLVNHVLSLEEVVGSIKDINKVFFDEFFTFLILTDVFILLISFLLTDKFYKVIRNSGFIISTILIKLSFGTDGLVSTILIVVAVLFGVIILRIHNLYEQMKNNVAS